MWAVVNSNGYVDLSSVKSTKKKSIDAFVNVIPPPHTIPWSKCQETGWTCVRINIKFEIL